MEAKCSALAALSSFAAWTLAFLYLMVLAGTLEAGLAGTLEAGLTGTLGMGQVPYGTPASYHFFVNAASSLAYLLFCALLRISLSPLVVASYASIAEKNSPLQRTFSSTTSSS